MNKSSVFITAMLVTVSSFAGSIAKDASTLHPWEVKFDSSFVDITESQVSVGNVKLDPQFYVRDTVLSKDPQKALSQLVTGFNSFEQLEIDSNHKTIKSFTAVIKINFDNQQIKCKYELMNDKYILSSVKLDSYGFKDLVIDITSSKSINIGDSNLVAFSHWNELTKLSVPYQIDLKLNKQLVLFMKYSAVFGDAEFLSLLKNEHYKTIIFKGQIRLARDNALDSFSNTSAGMALSALIMMLFGYF